MKNNVTKINQYNVKNSSLKWLHQPIVLDETSSTNDFLSRMHQRQLFIAHGTCVRSRYQHHGKGQYGRKWHSVKDQDLLCSYSLSTQLDLTLAYWLHVVSSIAIGHVLDKLSLTWHVKWPNDIYIGQKKIAGILVQNLSQKKRIQASLIGIGINVNGNDYGLSNKATSIQKELGQSFSIDALHALLTKALSDAWSHINDAHMQEKLFATYNRKLLQSSSWISNKWKDHDEVLEHVSLLENGMILGKNLKGDLDLKSANELSVIILPI